jgi:hypothetical protein
MNVLSAMVASASSDESVRREAVFTLANMVANAHERDVERIARNAHTVGALARCLVSSSSSSCAAAGGEEEPDPLQLMRVLLECLHRLLGCAASHGKFDSDESASLPPPPQTASDNPVAQEMRRQGVEAALQKLASSVTASSSSAAAAAAAAAAGEPHRQFVRVMASDMLCTYFSA